MKPLKAVSSKLDLSKMKISQILMCDEATNKTEVNSTENIDIIHFYTTTV